MTPLAPSREQKRLYAKDAAGAKHCDGKSQSEGLLTTEVTNALAPFFALASFAFDRASPNGRRATRTSRGAEDRRERAGEARPVLLVLGELLLPGGGER